jgi:3-oxoacyl-[acyl-carrier protein] reductase
LLEGTTDPAATEKAILATIPLGRMGEADEIAKLAVFLGSEAASYMTGTAIQVDGGLVEGYA